MPAVILFIATAIVLCLLADTIAHRSDVAVMTSDPSVPDSTYIRETDSIRSDRHKKPAKKRKTRARQAQRDPLSEPVPTE